MTRYERAARLRAASLFAAAGIVAAGLTAACAKKQAAPTRPPIPVAITTARRSAVPITVNAIGTVSPMQTANVSAQVDGLILSVEFQEGQEVAKQQVLFRIDSRPYQAAYNQALANLKRDSASAAYAQIEVERYLQLVAKDYVTKEQADQQRTTAASALATVASDEAQLANAKFNLDNTTVRAPIAGRTGNLLVRAGNLVHGASSTPLVVINQIHPILVQFAVPASNLPDIQKYSASGPLPVTAYQAAIQPSGQAGGANGGANAVPADASGDTSAGRAVPPATTVRPRGPAAGGGGRAARSGPPTLASAAGGGDTTGSTPAADGAGQRSASGDQSDSAGQGGGGGPPGGGVYGAAANVVPTGPPINGSLSFVNNAIDTATGTVLLKATFSNGKGELWPGEYVATVLRLTIEQGALVVPPQAVMIGQQGTYVFVIDPRTNTAQQRAVTVQRSTDSLAVIGSGLAEGEHVVTDGQSRLQNGAKVTVRAVTGGGPPSTAARVVASPTARAAG